jgi:hypothetical protein
MPASRVVSTCRITSLDIQARASMRSRWTAAAILRLKVADVDMGSDASTWLSELVFWVSGVDDVIGPEKRPGMLDN